MVFGKPFVAGLAERTCKRCDRSFRPTAFGQKFCGHQRVKGTCSWFEGREANRRYIASHPEKILQYRKRWEETRDPVTEQKRNFLRRLSLYGMTEANFAELVEQQQGRCALCDRHPGTKGLQIDHCHITGKIRGLLCMTCNTRLGYIESDWMDKAKKYLGVST